MSTSPTPSGTLDVATIRAHIPALRSGTAFFDGPGGTQTPDVVAQAVYDTLTSPLSNRGDLTAAECNAERAVVEARTALADLVGGDPAGVVFGRSMTQLTMGVARTMAKRWGPGDEVVVTRLDHDANVRPWMLAAEAVGATVRFADFNPETGELDPGEVARVLSARTRLVAITAASNLIGTIPDLPAIAELTHATGAWLFVDGVHYAAHAATDVTTMGADFFACSPYKFLGPHCGALYGRPDIMEQLAPDKLRPSSNRVPERFELGTLPYELMAGTTAAIDFMANLTSGSSVDRGDRRARLATSMALLEQHEARLRLTLEAGLAALPGVTLYSRARRRTPTLLMTFEDRDPQDVRRFLAQRGINAPAGSFYAYEPARRLGLGTAGGLRVGLAPYNDETEVHRLLEALAECLNG